MPDKLWLLRSQLLFGQKRPAGMTATGYSHRNDADCATGYARLPNWPIDLIVARKIAGRASRPCRLHRRSAASPGANVCEKPLRELGSWAFRVVVIFPGGG
jgi:hypothetical protein